MSDIKMFSCTQGTISHNPIVDFVRVKQDGLTAVYITNNDGGTGYNDRMIVVSTDLPSTFFGTTNGFVDCTGTLVYEFEADEDIARGRRRRRASAEASIRAISGPAPTGSRELNTEAESEFSVEVYLAAKPASGNNIGLIVGVSVAGAVAIAAIALLATKSKSGLPLVRVSKLTQQSKAFALDINESITDDSSEEGDTSKATERPYVA